MQVSVLTYGWLQVADESSIVNVCVNNLTLVRSSTPGETLLRFIDGRELTAFADIHTVSNAIVLATADPDEVVDVAEDELN